MKRRSKRKPYEALDALMENSSIGISVIDKNHKIIHVNSAMAAMFKKAPEDFMGCYCFREYEKRDSVCPHCPGTIAMATGKMVEVSTEGVRDDGTFFCARLCAVPYNGPDNKLAGFIEMVEDVTEKKHAEDMLKQEQNFSKTIVETAQVIMLVLDMDGNIISFNPYMEAISGYSLDEVKGKDWFSICVPEERRETIRELFNQAIGDIQTRGVISPIITKDHRRIDIEWYDKTLRDSNGNIRGLLSIGQDVTERLRKEKVLRKLHRKAREANEAKSFFLANMSHEIRTPLNAIIGFGNLLAEEVDLNPTQKKYLDTICLAGQNLLLIINDILDFSKIEAGKLNMEFVEYSVSELIENVELLMQPMAREKGINFTVHMDDHLPPMIQTDPLRLRQCLINLVNNAIKFTEKGVISLQVTSEIENRQPYLRFAVQDTGIGIEKEKIDTVFEAFTQADFDTTRKYGGTGLGLAITKHLVELLGGTISVSSQIGKGSTFSITVPVFVDGKKLSNKPIFGGEHMDQTLEENPVFDADILVAEDVVTNQMLIRALLEKLGARVTLVENGQEAILSICNHRYDLVFMDIQMPIMNGYEAMKRIRRIHPDLPIIALTANAMSGDSEKCFRSGANDYLSKPIDPKKLSLCLRKYLPANNILSHSNPVATASQ